MRTIKTIQKHLNKKLKAAFAMLKRSSLYFFEKTSTMQSLARSFPSKAMTRRISFSRPSLDHQKQLLHRYQLQELLTLSPIDQKLTNLPSVLVKSTHDIIKVPKNSGVYFIATDEPIKHAMHSNQLPSKLDAHLEIVYNGTASDLRSRIKSHLLRDKNKGMSGISVDLLITGEEVESHTKIVASRLKKRCKTPFDSDYNKLIIENLPNQLHLSKQERLYLRKYAKKVETIYFQNGINVTHKKHTDHNWLVYFQEVESHSVRDIIENTWRREYGMPRLCSYKEGR